MAYALNLDEPPIQGALLRYLGTMGQCLLRAAQAVEQGESGRTAALEELAVVTLLARYLRYRLREREQGELEEQEPEPEEEAPPCL